MILIRLLSAGLLGAALLGVASCMTAPVATASAGGCTPARQIYQPGVSGAPGTFIHLPGNCPSAAEIRRAEAAAVQAATTGAATPEPPDNRPVPPALADGRTAVANGVEQLCAWLYSRAQYSLPAFQQKAFDAGYRRGSSVSIIPLPEMRVQPAFSAWGFQAVIANAPPEGSGVAAFASFHDPVCQIQVYNYGAAAEQYLSGLTNSGWRRVGAATRPSANVTAERYFGGPANGRMTLVVNRWTGAQPAPGGLSHILNVVPGEDRTRGELS